MIIKFNFCILKGWLKEAFIRRNESCRWLDRQTILRVFINDWENKFRFSRNSGKKTWIFYCAIFVLIFLVILYVTTPHLTPSHPDYSRPWDHHWYIAMALDPFKPVNAPFTYRILPSLIAWLLPFELTINFQIITLISLFCTGIILYDLYRQYFDALLAFTGITLFFSLEFAARFLFYDFWLPDALAFFFMTLCFWAITKSKLVTYSLSLTIGVLCKEIVLFKIPVFLIYEFSREKITKESLFRVIKGIAPALLLFVVLRILFVPAPQIDNYDYFLLLQTIGIQRLITLPNSLYRYQWSIHLSLSIPFCGAGITSLY